MEVVAGLLNKSEDEVAEAAYKNSLRCFNL